jgi:methylmalonyl-CoA/ethylmalonyl-CoA epimerase
MTSLKLHHIGIVVKDLDRSLNQYRQDFGFLPVTDVVTVDNQGVRVVLLSCGSDAAIELIEAINEDSPAYTAARQGGGLNHLCYETADFDGFLERFQHKIVRSARPSPMNLFGGRRTAFIFRHHQLIELLEAESSSSPESAAHG